VKSLVDEIPFLSKIYDEPLQHLSSVQMYKLCSSARDHDIKVLISGEGSDEIFCGYDRYDRIFTLVDEMTNGDYTLEDILYYGGGLDNAEIVSNICGFEMTTIDDDLRGESYRWLREHKDIPLMDLVMLYDQRHRLQTILQRQDRMGMAASIELRQPFLNYRLINAVNSIDSSFKFEESTRETKYILKRVSEKYIPQDIISRKKVGFSSDLTLWFRSRSSRDQLNDLVCDSSSITRNYLDLKLIESVIEAHYNASKYYDFLVKSLYYLEVWNRHR
jgi:asparagine synthase (glutamine-hydrolysing)